MSAGNDFWLNLHRLVLAYDNQGTCLDDRKAAILGRLAAMPHISQQEVVGELRRMAIHLPELYAAVAAALETQKQPPPLPPADAIDGS
jgi:hypothetical protein